MGEPSEKYDIVAYKVNDLESEQVKLAAEEISGNVEETGLSGIMDAFPGCGHDYGSSLFDFAIDKVDNLVDGMARHLGVNATKNEIGQLIVYHTTNFIMLEVAQFFFDGVGGFTGGNTLGFSIAQLKVLMCINGDINLFFDYRSWLKKFLTSSTLFLTSRVNLVLYLFKMLF